MQWLTLTGFDCLNVRSTTEQQRKRKPFLAPYTAVDDETILWMETTFLGYLNEWKESTQNRLGEFTENARSKMFLSWQTHGDSRLQPTSFPGPPLFPSPGAREEKPGSLLSRSRGMKRRGPGNEVGLQPIQRLKPPSSF